MAQISDDQQAAGTEQDGSASGLPHGWSPYPGPVPPPYWQHPQPNGAWQQPIAMARQPSPHAAGRPYPYHLATVAIAAIGLAFLVLLFVV